MNNNHPINADPRPKRRRKKDNPYVLFTIGINTDHPQYYVRFKDGENHLHCEEISRELYEQLDVYELDDLSEMNENDRHIEQSEVSENSLHRRAAEPMEPTHEGKRNTGSWSDLTPDRSPCRNRDQQNLQNIDEMIGIFC